MNNNTTLYDGMSEENELIKDIEEWETRDGESAIQYTNMKDWFSKSLALNREARRLLTRAKELL